MRLVILAVSIPVLCAAAEIPPGTHVLLRLVNSVSTRTAREGDYVYMKTATPIVVGGHILVPADSYVQGVVTQSRRSGRVTGRAELGLRIETLTLPGGKVIRIAPQLKSVDSEGTDQKVETKEGQVQQGGSKGADAARAATIAASGAAIGGLADRSWKGAGIGGAAGGAVGLATVLLTRGREVELHQGSTVDVVFERAVPVD
jgi:type IV secretion system protein VirB10